MFGRKNKRYTDDEILKGFIQPDERVISFVYRYYLPITEGYILKNGGTREDAQDKFQDAMCVIFERLRSGSLQLTSAFGTYLFSICKKLWLYELRKRKGIQGISLVDELMFADDFGDSLEFELMLIKQNALFRKHFDALDEGCKELLRLFLAQKPFKEIKEILGFEDEMQAIRRKSKCKELLTRRITNDPDYRKLK